MVHVVRSSVQKIELLSFCNALHPIKYVLPFSSTSYFLEIFFSYSVSIEHRNLLK